MFSGRRDDGPEVCEDLRTLECAECSGDFHAHLHHAQVLFGLIVGEGDREVGDEPQDVIAVVTQSQEQVVAWPPGFSAAGAGAFDQRGLAFVKGEPLGEDRHVSGDDILANRFREFGLASILSLTPELIGAVEYCAHLCCLRLLLDLFDGLEFAQVMRSAEGVGVHPTHMGVIGFPVVMNDRPAGQKGWNSTALGVDAVMREGAIAYRVQPVQLAGDTQAGLVQMPNAAVRELGNNMLDHATQGARRTVHPVGHAGCTQAGGPKQVAQEQANPILGYQLLNIAIDSRRPHARAILHMRGHAIGKVSRRRGATMVATINRRLMLGDLQTRRGQVEYLTFLHPLRHGRRQGALTRAAMRRLMPFHEVGRGRLTQGVAPVTNLAAAFLAGFATQAARCRLLQAITRRGLAAITAVPRQLPAKHCILFRHARQPGFQLGDPAQSSGETLFKGGNLIHSNTDSHKSTRRHRILRKTKPLSAAQ